MANSMKLVEDNLNSDLNLNDVTDETKAMAIRIKTVDWSHTCGTDH